MAAAATTSPTEIDPKARFFRYFQHEVTALQEEMARLTETGVSGGERSDGVEHCLAGIARLSNEVKESSSRIPAYDLRTYDEAIKALSEKLQKTRAAFGPRPKFTFKSAMRRRSTLSSPTKERGRPEQRMEELHGQKSAPAAMEDFPVDDEEPTMDGEHGHGIKPHKSGRSEGLLISDREGTHVALPESISDATSTGNVSNIGHCVIDISASSSGNHPFSSLTVKNVTESLLLCGNVSGPAHITGIEGCVIVVASMQLRMHDCTNCEVYLHCSSRPIIERCQGISFTPLPETYMAKTQRETTNKFDQVDDFNWLKAEHSPNWRVLPSEERTKESVWKNVVSTKADIDVDDVLKATGVIR